MIYNVEEMEFSSQLILLKSPLFIPREPQDERRAFEIVGDLTFMLRLV